MGHRSNRFISHRLYEATCRMRLFEMTRSSSFTGRRAAHVLFGNKVALAGRKANSGLAGKGVLI